MKINAAIFDMNGVFILDSGPLSQRVENDYKISSEDFFPILKTALKQVRVPGANTSTCWQPVLEKLGLSTDEFFKYWFQGETLNTDLLQYVKELKEQGIKTIILSNNFPERTNNYRKLYPELFNVIDEQYFSWETGNIKPNKESFTQILNAHTFLPEDYIYFDDNDENLAAASNLGITAHKYLSVEDIKKTIIKTR